MATDAAWDGSASRYPDTETFCKYCLIDSNPSGEKKIQANCKLPYAEPDGTLNSNAVHAAAAALAGARGGLKDVSAQDKKAAARKLVRLYGELKETPPDSIKNMAQ